MSTLAISSVTLHIAHCALLAENCARSSPIEIVPNRVQLVGFGRHDDRACRRRPGSELNLRWALGLERDSRRLVNGGKMEVDATVAFMVSGGRMP